MKETIENSGDEEKKPTPETLRKFKEALRDWRVSPDGEDFCPDCWPKYLNKFDNKYREMIQDDSSPLSKYAETRKASNGWFALCEECKKDAFVPY